MSTQVVIEFFYNHMQVSEKRCKSRRIGNAFPAPQKNFISMTMLRQTCDMSVELDRGSIFAPETHCIIIVHSSFKRKPQQAILGWVCFEIDSDPDINKIDSL